MSFREKIDKILRVNTLKINSVNGLEKFIEASNGSISKYYQLDEEPGGNTIKKILSLPGLNQEWWDSGKGEVFVENSTAAIKSTDRKGFVKSAKETFYTDLIESNDQYNLIPRAVLTDYKIVPDKIIDVIIKSTEDAKAALEKSKDLEIESLTIKHETIIEGLNNKIKRLEREIDDLRGQIPGQ
jgi:hypothetical protein